MVSLIHRARIDHIYLTHSHLLKGEDANYLRDLAILSTHYSDEKAENVYNVTWSDVARVNWPAPPKSYTKCGAKTAKNRCKPVVNELNSCVAC